MLLSRRQIYAWLIAIGAMGIAVPALRLLSSSTSDEWSRKYGLAVVVADEPFSVHMHWGAITGRPASARQAASYTPILHGEFGLYPVELVRRTRLARIVLATDLAFNEQRRSAVADWEHQTLYLDVARGNYSPKYQRKVIHHEFFHIIDYQDDRLVYSDPDWSSLNPEDFRYGSGGMAVQDDPGVSLPSDGQAGFLNRYSMQGVEEDKAEMFANLIVEPEYVLSRSATDPIIAAKRNRMKLLLQAFSPGLDVQFWTKIESR